MFLAESDDQELLLVIEAILRYRLREVAAKSGEYGQGVTFGIQMALGSVQNMREPLKPGDYTPEVRSLLEKCGIVK